MNKLTFALIILLTSILTSCSDGVNFFTVQQDMEFGDSLVATIKANPKEYPILSQSQYPNAYIYLQGMMDDILESKKLKYKDKFDWELYIIHRDDVLNAFASPGGKVFVYTGLIKYLDDAASLAGVMGHEMAHADLRHSTKQMTKTYGFELLLGIILGNDPNSMKTIAADLALGLGTLKFSRDNEYEADKYSMYYLASTKYEPLGISSFFKKMIANKESGSTVEWLSTHPSDQNRVDAAQNTYDTDSELKSLMQGHTYETYADEYDTFIAQLP